MGMGMVIVTVTSTEVVVLTVAARPRQVILGINDDPEDCICFWVKAPESQVRLLL
jgi:hypothetical protein